MSGLQETRFNSSQNMVGFHHTAAVTANSNNRTVLNLRRQCLGGCYITHTISLLIMEAHATFFGKGARRLLAILSGRH